MFTIPTQQRAYSFVQTVANDCRSCFRRNPENCRICRSQWANSIRTDMETDMNSSAEPIDYSLHARIVKILSCLVCAQQPLLSKSIRLGDVCSNQLKQWTLKSMIKSGLVRRSFAFETENKKIYQYSITSKGKKYYENHVA